jgi:hypothetical protein
MRTDVWLRSVTRAGGSDQRSWGTGASPCLIFRALGTFCEPHRNPTSPRPGGDPHKNSTDETALCGTLVVLVKSMDNPVDQPLRA